MTNQNNLLYSFTYFLFVIQRLRTMKVFLSHSWAQREFVDSLASNIGLDFVVVDRFVFESGQKIEDEISSSLDSSNIFVMLISDAALESDWCKYELSNIRDLVEDGKCMFRAFIIDKNITPGDVRIKSWVRKYLLNYIESADILARIIKRSIKELMIKLDPNLFGRTRLFVGRDDSVNEIMQKLYENTDEHSKCIVISGFSHIGRKRLLREVMVKEIQHNLHPTYEPLDISLSETDSSDSLIKQLNEMIGLYQKLDLDQLLMDTSKHKDLSVELLNEASKLHERVRIDDSRCIVNPNGYIADWFIDIVRHPNLTNRVNFYIASSCRVNPLSAQNLRELVTVQLNPLTRSASKLLFNLYAQMRTVHCDSREVDYFLSELSGYPEQVYDVVDAIKEYDLLTAQRQLSAIQCKFDRDISRLVSEFRGDEKQMQLLILLSKFEYINVADLMKIFDEPETEEIIIQFQHFSVYEAFGANRSYLRMNHALSDYIDRNSHSSDFKLKRKYADNLRRFTKEILESTKAEELDLAEDLYQKKLMLADPRCNISTESILPSIALKVIIERYRNGDYETVINLGTKILYDENRKDYESLKKSIRYWLCLCYCKLGKDYQLELEKELIHFTGYTKFFLLGFYERNAGNFPAAQRFYELALNKGKNRLQHVSKASHELVITLMKQGNFGDALNRAESNYKLDSGNSYHIDAYFHCYVRSSKPDLGVLYNLKRAIERSYVSNKDVILKTFDAEVAYFIHHDFDESKSILEHVLIHMGGKYRYYAADLLKLICKGHDMMPIYNDIMSKSNGLEKDNKYVYEEVM